MDLGGKEHKNSVRIASIPAKIRSGHILNMYLRRANWTGHILCRNCFLKHVIEGKTEVRVEVTGRQERRCKQLLDDLMERRG
jgi:hypothetical protein